MPKPKDYNLNESVASASPPARPDWVELGDSGERQILKWGGDPAAVSPLTTGAFMSRAISTRFEVAPSPLKNLGTMIVLYGALIGLPAAAGIWAAFRVFG
jgi:hypothetical protein